MKDNSKIISAFLSESFPLSERTLNKLIAKLRKGETKNIVVKQYSYRVEDDLVLTNYTDHLVKEVCLGYSANRLLNAKNADKDILLAYKVMFLTSFYHEFCHEKQFDEYMYSNLKHKEQDEYKKLLHFDLKYLSPDYSKLSSLIEIDARLFSIKQIVSDINSGKIPDNKSIYPFILCEIFNMMKGINNSENIREFHENPFNYYRVLDIYNNKFEYLSQLGYEGKLTDTFKSNFKDIFESKMNKFFENEFKFVINKVIENYKPTKAGFVYLTSNWKERISKLVDKPTIRDLWVLTTDSVNQIKNQAQDFTYYKRDMDQFLQLKYNRCDAVAFDAFTKDTKKHKEFERFLLKKHIKENKLENVLE